eukprot:jgi/Tetstr1/441839/TSEL_030054.t1
MRTRGELAFIAICSDNANALALLVGELHISGVEVYHEGRTAPHEAVPHRCPGVIDWLLSHGCKHGSDLWLREDAGGTTPLLQAVREQYVEGVEAMCDSDVADDLSTFGTDTAQGAAVCRAYREATQGLSDPAAGRNAHRRLKRMLRAMERLLWVMGLYDVDTAARRQAGTRESAGPQEEWAESEAVESAVNAAQPGVVEWLLDVWGVDFEAAQLRDPVYSLSDHACGGGEVKSLKQRLRLLDDLDAKGGALRQAKITATLELFIDRFNERAVPRLDLLVQSGNWQVFEWLLSQNVINPRAPFVDSGAGEEEEEEEEEDEAICPVCIEPLRIPRSASSCNTGGAGTGAFSCPLCRRVVPFPRFAHSDVTVKLRGNLPGAAPWLFPSRPARRRALAVLLRTAGSCPGLPLGPVLLGMAVGMSSLRFVENLVAGGMDPFCWLEGRSLLHIACEQAAPGSALWLLEHARHAGRLPALLLCLDQQGRRPLEVAVAVCFQGPAFGRLLDMEPRLLDPAGREEAPLGAWMGTVSSPSSNETFRGAAEWHVAQAVLGGGLEERLRSGCPLAEVVQQLERNRCMERAMEGYHRTEFYRQSEIAAAAYAAGIVRARDGRRLRREPGSGAERAAPGMGEHVLRRFVEDQVVRHGRADVLPWMWLELDWQRWVHFTIPAGPNFASRDAVTAAASKWGLGSTELRLFRDVFDEADRLLEIKRLAKAKADDFSRAVLESGSVEAARAVVQAMPACASRVPESLRQCAFMRTHGKNTLRSLRSGG